MFNSDYKTSVMDLSVSECYALSFYVYNVLGHYRDVSNVEELQFLVLELIKKLKKQERAENIFRLFIEKSVAEKKLIRFKPTKTYNHSYSCHSKLTENFKQDEMLGSMFCSWHSNSELEINMIRAVYNDNDDTEFKKIFGMIFFSDKEYKSIPDTISIPSKVLKAVNDMHQIQFMVDALQFSKLESKILMFNYRTKSVKEFNAYVRNNDVDMIRLAADCVLENTGSVRRLFRRSAKFLDYGLFDSDGDINDLTMETVKAGELSVYFMDLVKEVDLKNAYDIDSFSVNKRQTEIVKSFLTKKDYTVSKNGLNILLYGKPGSGKTEYAKSLVKAAGQKCFIFKNENEMTDGENILCRLNCFLTIKSENEVIIVDEAEGLLKTQGFGMFGNESLPQKGLVNRMLENIQNRVIWILNYTHECDMSTLRRFTYSIKFDEMSKSMLQKIADTRLSKLEMTDELHSKLLDMCGKYRISGASVENMVKTVECSMHDAGEAVDDEIIMSRVKDVLESNSALLYGNPKMREKVSSEYDLEVLNVSLPAEKIVRMVHNAEAFANENDNEMNNGIRILFYGASGTGKTELARYIAESLGKKILLKRASDILGKFVGENEKNIREAFEQAESSGSILLFDEADSFFSDRSSAKNSWERTMVNEFLTQMEEFKGILICTTNLRKIMDPAMQRRFHILSEFKPMTVKGIRKMLHNYFSSWKFTDEDIDAIAKYDSVTPGDFSQLFGKIRFMDKEEIDSEKIVKELVEIQKEKNSGSCSRIGFCA